MLRMKKKWNSNYKIFARWQDPGALATLKHPSYEDMEENFVKHIPDCP